MVRLREITRVPGVARLRQELTREARLQLAWTFMRQEGLSASGAWRLSAVWKYTLLEPARLVALHRLASDLVSARTAGAFVECGSWAGGSGALLGTVAASDPGRRVWLFDSWEGVPAPSEHDIMYDGQSGAAGMFAAPRRRAEKVVFDVLKLGRERVRFVQGWFNETLSEAAPEVGEIALLHVDADWYESVKTCFDELYDRVVEGGVIVIDDYGCWRGCQTAVDDFLASRGSTVDLVPVDWTAVYFRKPRRRSDGLSASEPDERSSVDV